jgi:hypothetical protein
MRFSNWHRFRLDILTLPFDVIAATRPVLALRSRAIAGEKRSLAWREFAAMLRESPTGRVVMRVRRLH